MSKFSGAVDRPDLEGCARATGAVRELVEAMKFERVILRNDRIVIYAREHEDGVQICAVPAIGDYPDTKQGLAYFPYAAATEVCPLP